MHPLAWDKSVDLEPGRTSVRRSSKEREMTDDPSHRHNNQETRGLLSSQLLSNHIPGRTSPIKDTYNQERKGEEITAGYIADDEYEVTEKKISKWIILPDSRFRKTWLQVQLAIALYIIWVTPIRVGFDMQSQGFWFWMEGVVNIFFFVDLILNFFVAYEHPLTSELVTNHRTIALRYLKGWFIIDLLATFPSDYIVKGLQGTWSCSFRNDCYYVNPKEVNMGWIVMLRLMRVFRVFWIFKNMNIISIGTVIGRLQYRFLGLFWLVSVAELVLYLAFMGHFVGSFFYMFGGSPYWRTEEEKRLILDDEMTTWVLLRFGGYYLLQVPEIVTPGPMTMISDQLARDNATGIWYSCPDKYTIVPCPNCQDPLFRCEALFGFATRYVTAYYWSITTMTTVGYGDIGGISLLSEQIWAMFAMVVGGFFLSFTFGRMANIVGRMDADRGAKAEQMDQVTQFLKDVEVPKQLTRKVLDFFSTSSKSVRSYDRQIMLEKLPFDLRSKIMIHLYNDTIRAVPVLKSFADDDMFITELCTHLQPCHCSEDTFVYQSGEDDADVYILTRGEMHMVDKDRKTFMFKIGEGRMFGEGVVLKRIQGESRSRRSENVKCKSACDMLKLSAESMTMMCDRYPQLYDDLLKLDRSRRSKMASTYGKGNLATIQEDVQQNLPTWSAESDMSSLLNSAISGPPLNSQVVSPPVIPEDVPSTSAGEHHLDPSLLLNTSVFHDQAFALRDQVIGDEVAKLRQQVHEQQQAMHKQMELQRQLLLKLMAQHQAVNESALSEAQPLKNQLVPMTALIGDGYSRSLNESQPIQTQVVPMESLIGDGYAKSSHEIQPLQNQVVPMDSLIGDGYGRLPNEAQSLQSKGVQLESLTGDGFSRY